MKSTNVSLQLANRSVKYPIGVLEDVLVRVAEYYVSVYLVIIDIDKDSKILILLGRPFLDMAGPVIDVKREILNFEVGEEKIEFI